MKKPLPFDHLIAMIETTERHPDNTAWEIYNYLNANLKTMESVEARMLLATYMKIPVARPSLLHSCMLSVALRMAERFSDFRLPSFLALWGYDAMLRPEDRERQRGADGKVYLALTEKVERARQEYALRHSSERDGTEDIVPMVAVKVFETEKNGRKRRTVKLVADDGRTAIADSHIFPCKPWEIQNRVFDVLFRKNTKQEPAVSGIAPSAASVASLFPPVVGCMDRFDMNNGHYHVFDTLSRHFVAQGEVTRCEPGQFVMFSPIVPNGDKFKSAVILSVLPDDEGLARFGTYTATVEYIDGVMSFFMYKITSPVKPTPEGSITLEGSAPLSLLGDAAEGLRLGQEIRLVMFLTRGMDKKKRNHVARVIL